MKTIYLLSCCKQKLSYAAEARELYQSAGFKKSLCFAQSKNPDAIFILSALHHVVPLNEVLDPYNMKLSDQSKEYQIEWADECLKELGANFDLKNDKFVILAGKDYYKNLIGKEKIENYELPLIGLKQGYRLQWYDENTGGTRRENVQSKEEIICDNIHDFANALPRFSYPFDSSKLPENGVYVFFENGEKYKGKDRITRVGTHTGDGNLRMRIEQHLCNENKDRSVFRKNIGRALLNKENNPFLEQWNLDLTTKAAKEKYASKIDAKKIQEIESRVSEYMRNNFSFAVFAIDGKEERLRYERFLIKGISACKECKPSGNWLGLHSPIEKIRKSGMWLVNELTIKKQ